MYHGLVGDKTENQDELFNRGIKLYLLYKMVQDFLYRQNLILFTNEPYQMVQDFFDRQYLI